MLEVPMLTCLCTLFESDAILVVLASASELVNSVTVCNCVLF